MWLAFWSPALPISSPAAIFAGARVARHRAISRLATAAFLLADTTTAYAVCSTDATLHTQVVRADVIDHPAGAGNSNPGQDPVATATAACPVGATLLGGGALADGNAPGPDGGPPQQGVHLRGSYPSTAAATPVADGGLGFDAS